MIISLVSRRNRAGKTHLSQVLVRNELDFYKHSLTWNLSRVGDMFLGSNCGKYDIHPFLGVSKKDITHAVSKKLEDMHPELPVMLVKQNILQFVDDGHNVVIDDIRRERDFKWLDMVASNYKTHHYIIEIDPIGDVKDLSGEDTWTNGLEPCGYAVWRYRHRYEIKNDGTDKFEQEVIKLVESLVE